MRLNRQYCNLFCMTSSVPWISCDLIGHWLDKTFVVTSVFAGVFWPWHMLKVIFPIICEVLFTSVFFFFKLLWCVFLDSLLEQPFRDPTYGIYTGHVVVLSCKKFLNNWSNSYNWSWLIDFLVTPLGLYKPSFNVFHCIISLKLIL